MDSMAPSKRTSPVPQARGPGYRPGERLPGQGGMGKTYPGWLRLVHGQRLLVKHGAPAWKQKDRNLPLGTRVGKIYATFERWNI